MSSKTETPVSKKILIVSELSYPSYGGQEIRFMELGSYWAKSGHDVSMAVIDHTGELPEYEQLEGVKIYRLLKEPKYYKNGRFGRKLSTIFLFTLKLHKFFRQDYDIIIFNQFPVLPAIYHGLFFKSRKSKTVLDFVEHRSSKLWIKINKILLKSTGSVVCISKHVAECVGDYRRKNISVVPSLIKLENPETAEQTSYLFLGRLEHHKHPEAAIEAILKYNEKYRENKNIKVLGGGTMYKGLVEKYGSNPSVTFFGRISDEEKIKALSESRLLVFPSEREGLPKTVIEAMAFGIPTVTTNYIDNGTKYFVEDEKIGLVAEPDIESIADAIRGVENDYSKFRQECLNKRSEYYLSNNAEKYLNLNMSA